MRGQPEPVERADRDQRSLRRVEAAGDADHDPLDAGRRQPLAKRLDLDVVDLAQRSSRRAGSEGT